MFSKISLDFRRAFVAAFALSVIALSSCSDDDETTPPDTSLPEVKLTSSVTSDVVWNTMTLTVEATDDQEIAQIELKIDGVSVKTATTSPFDFAWDTQKATEGQHTITATATDKTGNPKTVELKATVQNVLVKAAIPSDLLTTGDKLQRGFIFLSDKDGKTIVAQEFKNGDAVELRSPTYNESAFVLTEVIYNSDNYASLTTFTKVNRGNWAVSRLGSTDDGLPSLGLANLTFTNADPNILYSMHSNGDYTEFVKDNITASLNLTSTPGMLYVHDIDETHYGFFNTLKVGSNSPINLGLVNTPFTEETLRTPDGFGNTQIEIWGLHTATTKNRDYIWLGTSEFGGSEYKLNYPGNAFPAYYSETRLEDVNTIAYMDVKKVYDLTPLSVAVNVSLTGNKYTGSITSTAADYVMYYLTGGESSFDWAFISGTGDQSILIPEVPAIVAAVIDPIVLEDTSTGVTVADLFTLTGGYDGMLQFIRASTYGTADLYKDFVTESKEIQIDEIPGSNGAGGRKNNGREERRRFTDTWR